jgi:tetratricopeptide (TPR) repeat protein
MWRRGSRLAGLVVAVLVALLVLFRAAPIEGQIVSRFQVRNASRAGVVRLVVEGVGAQGERKRETGTGFVVSREGHVLTAAHVVGAPNEWEPDIASGAPRRRVAAFGLDTQNQSFGFPSPVVVVDYRPDLGLALLKLPDAAYRFLPVSTDAPVPLGSRVYALGFAAESELRPMAGTVDALADPARPGTVRVRDLGAVRGDSGGPVFDAKGEMIVGLIDAGDVFEPVSYFVPLAPASTWLGGILRVPAKPATAAPPVVAPSDEPFVNVVRTYAKAAKDGFVEYSGGRRSGDIGWVPRDQLPYAECIVGLQPRSGVDPVDYPTAINCRFYSGDNYGFAAQTFDRIAELLEHAFPTWSKDETNRLTFDSGGIRSLPFVGDGAEIELRLFRQSSSTVTMDVRTGWSAEPDTALLNDPCLWRETTRQLLDCARQTLADESGQLTMFTLSRRKEAGRLLRMALVDEPSSTGTHYLLGLVEFYDGEFPAAEQSFRRALALRKSGNVDSEHVMLARSLSRQGKFSEAIDTYREALEGLSRRESPNPTPSTIRHEIAAALVGANRLDEAVAAYRELVAETPGDAELHRGLGRALIEKAVRDKGDVRPGRAEYARSIQLDPTDPVAHEEMAFALRRIGKTKDAIKALEKAIKLLPEYPSLHFNLAVTLKESGKRPAAERVIRRYLELMKYAGDESDGVRQARQLLAEVIAGPR